MADTTGPSGLRALADSMDDEMTFRLRHQIEMRAFASQWEADQRRIKALTMALQHERWCRTCAEDGCANCNECTTTAAIAVGATWEGA